MTVTEAKERGNVLLEILRTGLEQHAERSTKAELGDRTSYIGLSDLGAMQDCPRMALARKMMKPTYANNRDALRRQLIMQRGHWLEGGIQNAFAAHGLRLFTQLEIVVPDKNVPIKAHLDFVLIDTQAQPTVRILELKSMEDLPSAPPLSYATQVQMQTSLLKAYWNCPVFSLPNTDYTNMTFPQLCQAVHQQTFSSNADTADIQGWLLCLSMSKAKTFGAFLPESKTMDTCFADAQYLWQSLQDYKQGRIGLNEILVARGTPAACAYCEYNADCPKFEGEVHDEWTDKLEELAELKEEKKYLENRIDSIEQNIKANYSVPERLGKWIQAGIYRFRVAQQKGRITFDKVKLIEELSPMMGKEEAENLIKQCEVQGEPFTRFYLNTAKAHLDST
jgi:hypothetical protein